MLKEVVSIQSRLNKLKGQLADIQRCCPHKNYDIKHGSNTGNYDPTADLYWTDYHCLDCDKYWTIYKK